MNAKMHGKERYGDMNGKKKKRRKNRIVWARKKHTQHTNNNAKKHTITVIIIIVIWLQLSYSILTILVRFHLNIGSIVISRCFYIIMITSTCTYTCTQSYITKRLSFIFIYVVFLVRVCCGKSSTRNDRNLLKLSEVDWIMNLSWHRESCDFRCTLPSICWVQMLNFAIYVSCSKTFNCWLLDSLQYNFDFELLHRKKSMRAHTVGSISITNSCAAHQMFNTTKIGNAMHATQFICEVNSSSQ